MFKIHREGLNTYYHIKQICNENLGCITPTHPHQQQKSFMSSEQISTHTVNIRTQLKGPDLRHTHFEYPLDPYDDVTEFSRGIQFCMALANS